MRNLVLRYEGLFTFAAASSTTEVRRLLKREFYWTVKFDIIIMEDRNNPYFALSYYIEDTFLWKGGEKMPLQLRRRNGSVTPFRNSEYLPFYYFIPKSILKKCGAELNAIPRNPREIFNSWETCEFIESDLFLLLIIDATAYLVWPHI